jgi:hypothetical protein
MEKENFFVEMKDMVEEYAEDRILLLKLQATEKAARVSSSLFLGIVVGALGCYFRGNIFIAHFVGHLHT